MLIAYVTFVGHELQGQQKLNSLTYNFVEVFGHNLESSLSGLSFTLQTSFKPLLLGVGGKIRSSGDCE
jgi:hypothetical protein